MEKVNASLTALRSRVIEAGRIVSPAAETLAPYGPVWDEGQTLKEDLKGSLIQLQSGNFAFVPPTASFGTKTGVAVISVHEGGATAHKRDKEWWELNVKSVMLPGFLTVGASSGKGAAALRVGELEAILRPVIDTPIVELELEFAGLAQKLSIKEALEAVGLEDSARPALGGTPVAAMVAVGGIPSLTAASTVNLNIQALVGGTTLAMRRASTLVALQVGLDPTGDALAAHAATFIAGVVKEPSLRNSVLVTICATITDPATASAEETAAVAARDAVRAALGSLLDVLPSETVLQASHSCTSLALTPHWAGAGQSGGVLRHVAEQQWLAEQRSKPVVVPPGTAPPVTAPPGAVPPVIVPPASPATTPEITAMKAKMLADEVELRRLQLLLGPPPGGAPIIAPIGPPPGGAPIIAAPAPSVSARLEGIAIISPALAATIGASPVDIWTQSGSEHIMRRLAMSLNEPFVIDTDDPLNKLTGVAGAHIAAQATADLEILVQQLLERISLLDAARQARYLPSVSFTDPPADYAQSIARLLSITRAASDLKALASSGPPPGEAAPPAAQPPPALKPPTGSGFAPLALTTKSPKIDRHRSVDPTVLAPLANASAVWAGHHATGSRAACPITEARRQISVQSQRDPSAGPGVSAFFLSNGKVSIPLAGEMPVDIQWASFALQHHVHVSVTDHVGDNRRESTPGATAAEVTELVNGIMAIDIDFTSLVRLLGGTKPVVTWGAGREGTRQHGIFGCITGAAATRDIATAMRRAGPILVDVLCGACGAPPAADPSLGLVRMAEAAELVSDQIRKEFFEEFFRAASTRTAAHRRGGPLPDLEALASSAITESLEPRMNIADSACPRAAMPPRNGSKSTRPPRRCATRRR